MSARNTDPDSVWSRVDRSGGPESCWPWKGFCGPPMGYGRVRWDGRQYLLHRWSAEQSGMAIERKIVRHTCDNPPCCNPAHLLIGSVSDNVADRVSRRRSARGSSHGRSRLSEQDVRDIHEKNAKGITQVELAKEYGMNYNHINDIIRGKRWSHFKPESIVPNVDRG